MKIWGELLNYCIVILKTIIFTDVKKHVIMFDCDSKDSSIGMTCPPKPFIETEFLKKVDKILHPEGNIYKVKLKMK